MNFHCSHVQHTMKRNLTDDINVFLSITFHIEQVCFKCLTAILVPHSSAITTSKKKKVPAKLDSEQEKKLSYPTNQQQDIIILWQDFDYFYCLSWQYKHSRLKDTSCTFIYNCSSPFSSLIPQALLLPICTESNRFSGSSAILASQP